MNEIRKVVRYWMIGTLTFVLVAVTVAATFVSYKAWLFENQTKEASRSLIRSHISKEYSSIAEQVLLNLDSLGSHQEQLQNLMAETAKITIQFINDKTLAPQLPVDFNPTRLISWNTSRKGIDTLDVPLFFADQYLGLLELSVQWIGGDKFSIFYPSVIALIVTLLSWLIVSAMMKKYVATPLLKKMVDFERAAAVADLASHVSHDIRSPLKNVEDIVSELQALLPGDKAQVVESAIDRIWQITEELLQKGNTSGQADAKIKRILLWSVIKKVVREKRAANKKFKIEITCEKETGCDLLFSNLDELSFVRVLSNLIDNGIEASPREHCHVKVCLRRGRQNKETLEIIVVDNGEGIPPDALKSIGEKGFTTKSGGHGLGVYYAKQFTLQAKGQFHLNSTLGMGTQVTLSLPVVRRPSWYKSVITANPQTVFVILDDDQSTHDIWKTKIPASKIISHLAFNEGEFLKLTSNLDAIFLIDEQLSHDGPRGHEIIAKFKLGQRATLVTSYYDDSALQDAALNHGFKILPKGQIHECLLNICAPDSGVCREEPLDLVLIDDEALTPMAWAVKAKAKKMNFASFKDKESFLNAAIDLKTPIYVDLNFGRQKIGVDITKELHERGYVDLHLATASPGQVGDMPDYIKSVQGKAFPV